MSKQEKYRVEFRSDTRYSWLCEVIIDWKEYVSDIRSIDAGNTLKSIHKRLYNQWLDGVTIFELTLMQLEKLKKILNEINLKK